MHGRCPAMKMLVILLFIAVASGEVTNGTRVKTEQGIVEGFTEDGVVTFYGIPYAGDVSGAMRFKAAPPPPSIKGVFKAVEKKVCAQPSPKGIEGVENCLTLNLFTKNVTGNNPVIVWIAGEDYSKTNDTSKYSFKSLVKADTVFIELNYRLSVFGFLCLGVKEAPGNAGLKDVIQALKWLKANVASFGGDPNNVILLGHGSGAAMADLITLSPQAKDLVHKVIAISGSGIAPWAVAFDPAGYAKAFAAKFNITDNKPLNLAQKLTKINGDELAHAVNEFEFTNNSVLFAPCVENRKLKDSFLVDAPINLIKAGKHLQIPYIAIYVSDEGTLRLNKDYAKVIEKMQKNFTDFLPVDLKLKNETANISQKILKYYSDGKHMLNTTFALEYWGDSAVTVPMIRGVRERAAAANNKTRTNVYIMKFDYKETSAGDWPYYEIHGMRHGAILKYIFDMDSVLVNITAKSSIFNRIIAFAAKGTTTAPMHSPGDVTWPPVTSNAMNYINIVGDNATRFQESASIDPEGATWKFWNEIISQYYAVPQPVTSSAVTINIGLSFVVCLFLLIMI